MQEEVKIKIKKTHPDTIIPEYAHDGDSGMDVYSVEELIIPSGERRLVGSGLSFEIPEGYEIQIRPKSGLATNYGITNLNAPGTIDSNYRGEIKGILFNSGKEAYPVKKHSKIFQIVLQKSLLLPCKPYEPFWKMGHMQKGKKPDKDALHRLGKQLLY